MAALLDSSNGRISTRVRCYIRSAAVKATVDYASLLFQRRCEQSCRFHERLQFALLLAGSYYVVSPGSDFSKHVKTLPS
jgi:hypothetical protein